MANKGVEVEQAHGYVGTVGLIAGLLGEAPGGDVGLAIAPRAMRALEVRQPETEARL